MALKKRNLFNRVKAFYYKYKSNFCKYYLCELQVLKYIWPLLIKFRAHTKYCFINEITR